MSIGRMAVSMAVSMAVGMPVSSMTIGSIAVGNMSVGAIAVRGGNAISNAVCSSAIGADAALGWAS